MKIVYQWTGVSKIPEHGDWYLNFDGLPKQMDKTMTTAEPDRPYFILDRQEIPVPGGKRRMR